MSVHLYVEGGGDSKELHIRCREGFRKLLEAAGLGERMPRVVAGGGRNATFDRFRTAVRICDANTYPMLLVDSEEVVIGADGESHTTGVSPDSDACWRHLQARDGRQRPPGAQADQAQLMVTSMETWIIADRATLRRFFGSDLQLTALLPIRDLEVRDRAEVLEALERATRSCGRERAYAKGRRAFAVLATLDPAVLRETLPHFDRFLTSLERRVTSA